MSLPWWAWSGGSLPTKPTRQQLCTGQLTFQGFQCQTQQFGRINCQFPLDVLTPTDRQSAYAAMHALGDTMALFMASHAYLEPGIPPPLSTPMDWTQNLSGLRALLIEAISNGFLIDLRLAGDGESIKDAQGNYIHNDPVGWTYGAQWLIENFPRIVDGLGRDIAPYIRWCPGFDGVWYGWTAEQIQAFGTLFRSVLPDGVLSLEFVAGVCHLGGGKSDYEPGGGLYEYDVFQSEYDTGNNGGHNDTLWQVGARMLGPAYIRPPDQPPFDDPGAPFSENSSNFYLSVPTPRGPRYTIGIEDWLYEWCRDRCALQTVTDYRSYKQSVGYAYVG